MESEKKVKYSVYALTLKGNCVYVGCTSNVIKRLRSHKMSKEFDWHIVIESFDNKNDALACERGIIKFLTLFPNGHTYNKEYATFAVFRDSYIRQ